MVLQILFGLALILVILVVIGFINSLSNLNKLNKIDEDLMDALDRLEEEMNKRHPIFEVGQEVKHRLSGEKMIILSTESYYRNTWVDENDFYGIYTVSRYSDGKYLNETFVEEELEEIKTSPLASNKVGSKTIDKK